MNNPASSSPVKPRRKIGLALSSGVSRGWAHIGAIKALRAMGIEFDIITGCSAGALVGGCYAAGIIDVLEDWACSLNRRKIMGYMDVRLRNGGIIAANKLTEEMRKHLGDVRIEDCATTFAAVATDLYTGHEFWMGGGDMVSAIRASFAMPGIFPPVQIDNHWLSDGAIVCPAPVGGCRARGADLVISVNLNVDMLGRSTRRAAIIPPPIEEDEVLSMIDNDTEHDDPERKPLLHNLGQWLLRRTKTASTAPAYDGPSFPNVMATALNIMQERISMARLAGDPPDVSIEPRLGHFGVHEFDRADEAIKEGYAAVMRRREELEDALQILAIPRPQGSETGDTPPPKPITSG